MGLLTSLKALFIKSTPEDDFALAASFKNIAALFLFAVRGGAHVTGAQWIKKEPDFAAGYLQGFGDVIAQSVGRESGSMLGGNIAVQFAKFLLEEASNDEVNSFVEYSLTASGCDFNAGLEMGAQDGNGFLNKSSRLPRALVAHFQGWGE